MVEKRQGLSFTCSRRDFWPALLQELAVTYKSIKGQPGYKLAELGTLPDEQLAQIRPIINPEYEICVENEYVCCRLKGSETTRQLFQMNKANLLTFNLFNGQHSLTEIGTCLSEQMGWDQDQGFGFAKELFVALVERMVCVPRDPLVGANTDANEQGTTTCTPAPQ